MLFWLEGIVLQNTSIPLYHMLSAVAYPHDKLCTLSHTPVVQRYHHFYLFLRVQLLFVGVGSHLVGAFFAPFSCGLPVPCSRVGDGKRRSFDVVFGIPSSWILTVCSWTLNTLYGPDARCSSLLFQQFDISSAASGETPTDWGRSTNS